MNKLTLIAAMLLASTSLSSYAAGTISSLGDVPPVQQTYDFENEDGYIFAAGTTYSFGNLQITADQQFTVGQYIADLGENGVWGAGNHFVSFDHIGEMTLDLSFSGKTTTGFAFNYSAYDDAAIDGGAQFTVRYFDAQNNLIGSHNQTLTAFGSDTYDLFATTGYISNAANIAKISITGDGVVIDNLTVTTPVPEPETYAMLLAGLGLMGGMARRRKNA